MNARPALRLVLFVGVLGASIAPAVAANAQPAALPSVDVIKVEGTLDRPLLGFVNGMLDDASARGATVVLEVDSAGGIGQDGVGLADRIAQMSVPVIVWVGPVPARASGSAMLLMLASSLSAVAPGSTDGTAQPGGPAASRHAGSGARRDDRRVGCRREVEPPIARTRTRRSMPPRLWGTTSPTWRIRRSWNC